MNYWLIKSEPSVWSWTDQKSKKSTSWDGVRNYQAANYLKQMRLGDLAFFYHSVSEKQILGIVRITKEYYPDPTDPLDRFGMVDVSYEKEFSNPVTLGMIKHEPSLGHLGLVRQSRLSVMPIDPDSWQLILKMGHP